MALSKPSPPEAQENTYSHLKVFMEYPIFYEIYLRIAKTCFIAWAPKSLNTDRKIKKQCYSSPYLTPSGKCFEWVTVLILFHVKHVKILRYD